jgi:WD40 repeat protein
VITDIVEEGVGGFSELIKNRIVIPFNGSYNDLHHVVGHELVHIFEFRLFYRSRLSALLGAVSEFRIPLWVLEGFAEFQSGWVNVSSEAFMRDLVMNNRLVPLPMLHDGMGYLVYREGESFFHFVAEKYGRKKVYEFLHSLNSKKNIDGAFAAVFGTSIEKVSSEWEKWLRVRYWPQVVKLESFEKAARRLTNHVKDGSVYNTAPAISPSGTKVAMISDRQDYVDVYVISTLDGRVLKRLVKGGRSGGFETMHLLRPGVAWSPDEKQVAVVTTSAGRDNLAVIDYASGKVLRRIYGNLDAVYSPKFSPDGSRIVFVGIKNGFSDVYVVGVASGEPERITYDMYEERDPTFSSGGDTIAFVSDRPDPGQKWVPGAYALWLWNRSAGTVRLTDRNTRILHPEFTHSGEYLFYAADDSATNIYVYSLLTNRVVRRTNFLGEVSYLTLSKDDRKLSCAYYSNVGWDIAVLVDPLEKIGSDSAGPYRPPVDTFSYEKNGLDFDRVKPVGFDLSLDYAVGAASYTTGAYGGLAGVLNLAFSDMLGNHRFELYTDLYGDILNSDLVFQYWLLPFRTDFGLTLFQYRDYPYYFPDQMLVERMNRGGEMLAAYPWNRFMRAEFGLTGYMSEPTVWLFRPETGSGVWEGIPFPVEHIIYGSGALVFDNTFWNAYGPARGTRTRLGADASFLSSRQFEDVFLDFRDYQRLGPRTTFATRLLGITGFGRDADSFYVGGEDVRGYQWGEFYQKEHVGSSLGLLTFELRYPFIDRFKLAFPLPLELGGIRGVAFADAGMVFRKGMQIWDSEAGRLDDLKVGVGVGARVSLSYFLLKFDFAKPLSVTEDNGWKFVFGIGTDF